MEIFTGGGKTLIALECAAWASSEAAHLRVAVVVPTEALARQWVEAFREQTNVSPDDIGLLGAGRSDSFVDKQVLVCVINTAAQQLPRMAARSQPLMLIVDEAHRAGAPEFSNVLDTTAPYRLGLSATPEREEFDKDGEPLEFDEQVVGQKLGPIVYRFTFEQARAAGWLPELRIEHQGVRLRSDERVRYDRISRQVDDLLAELEFAGGDAQRARQLSRRSDALGKAAARYVALTSRRKDLLYRALERGRVAEVLAQRELESGAARILMFHERVAEAEALFKRLHSRYRSRVALEHSGLPDAVRADALQGFRSGRVKILVSVRSLVEGIDVPEADVGISVAASSSVRQRIQSMGRVLRRTFSTEKSKLARMHLIYVRDTVDELIYSKENWEQLTGAESNRYYEWPLDTSAPPILVQHPPRTPAATEEEEWARIGQRAISEPVEWRGAIPDRQFSVDSNGTVSTASGQVITSWPHAASMLENLRGEPGGRFHLTPIHRIVIAFQDGKPYAIGQLLQPIHYLDRQTDVSKCPDIRSIQAGDLYPGPLESTYGEFRLALKRGGVIERRRNGGRQFALTDSVKDHRLGENALLVLDAWRKVLDHGIEFRVNRCWHAWYLEAGTPRFLGHVEGGFEFPMEA